MDQYKNNGTINLNNGFTIIELVVVVVLIGILAAISYVSYGNIKQRAYDNSVLSDIDTLDALETNYGIKNSGALAYYSENGAGGDELGFTPSEGNVIDVVVDGDEYCIRAYNDDSSKYTIFNPYIKESSEGVCDGILPSEAALVDSPAEKTSFALAFGGSGSDVSRFKMTQTNDDGYVVAGQTDSFGAGGYDMIVAKYTYDGELSWAKTLGGTDVEYGYSVDQASDGSIYIAGQTRSYGAGSGDAIVAKYSWNGSLLWTRTLGGSYDYEYAYSLTACDDGGVALTGKIATWGPGNGEAYIAKFTSTGTLSWAKYWGSSAVEVANNISTTSDGGYVITGQTYSYSGGSDVFIAKYDSSGNLEWDGVWGGSGLDSGRDVIQLLDGGYVVVGFTDGFGAGGYDGFMLKYDSSGNLEWNKVVGTTGSDTFYSVCVDYNGDVYITGSVYNSLNETTDVNIAKYAINGELVWNKAFGGSGGEAGYSMIKADDNGIAIGGYTNSFNVVGNDVLLVKFGENGVINGCDELCTDISATETDPSATITNPSVTGSSFSPTITSPNPTESTPNLSETAILSM